MDGERVGQNRDEGDSFKTEPVYPTSEAEFVKRLEDVRTLSYRTIARATNISKSTVARWFAGATPVPMDTARKLDEVMHQDWIEGTVANLRQPTWSPWDSSRPAAAFNHKWPAKHNHDVWIRLVPLPERAGEAHEFSLTWGLWRQTQHVTLERLGALFVTGKSREDVAVDLRVESDNTFYAAFGPMPFPGPDIPVYAIHYDWH